MRHDRGAHPRPRRRALALGLLGLLTATVVVLVPLTRGRATAPPGRYATGTDAVLDTATGLLWQRAVPASSYTWVEALSYCESLSLGGFSDWRLPNIKELQTLVDHRVYNPAIDTTAFPSTPTALFWSSSPSAATASNASYAWIVVFDYGNIRHTPMTINLRVRCVR